MYNPFDEKLNTDEKDTELISAVLAGDLVSLEKLILRHQAWLFNISFKMVMDHDDACDITQEILIKIITRISSYDPKKAAFRTWLYRIVVNHILTMKKKKFELRINDFDTYMNLIENLPDSSPVIHPESEVMAKEFKIGCMMGMLMCLSRGDRLAFLLGAIFELRDTEGAELMEITRENFRKKLSRSRQKVFSHMNHVCGHVNTENTCRCKNKYSIFIEMGMINPDNIRYNKPNIKQVKDIVEQRLDRFSDRYYDPFINHFQEQPFYDSPDMIQWFRNIIRQDEFKGIFNMQ